MNVKSLFAESQDFVGFSIQADGVVRNEVDEVREGNGQLVGVAIREVGRSFMDRVITDQAAGVAKLLDARVKVEAQHFGAKVVSRAAQLHAKAFKAQSKHGARAPRGAAEHSLRLFKGFERISRQVLAGFKLGEIGPDHLVIHPERQFAAMKATPDVPIRSGDELRLTRHREPLSGMAHKDRVAKHLGHDPAVRAGKCSFVC